MERIGNQWVRKRQWASWWMSAREGGRDRQKELAAPGWCCVRLGWLQQNNTLILSVLWTLVPYSSDHPSLQQQEPTHWGASLYHSLTLSLSISLSLPPSPSLPLSSLSTSLSLSLPPPSLPLSISLPLSHSLPLSLYPPLSLYLSNLTLSLPSPLSLPLYLSLPLSHASLYYPPLSLSLSTSLSLSLSSTTPPSLSNPPSLF